MDCALWGKSYELLIGNHRGDNCRRLFAEFWGTYRNNNEIFQEKYYVYHLIYIARHCFEEHTGRYKHMILLPRSPDMNLEEYLGYDRKRYLCSRSTPIQDPIYDTTTKLWAGMKAT